VANVASCSATSRRIWDWVSDSVMVVVSSIGRRGSGPTTRRPAKLSQVRA
jgi:hypothetical protein